MNMKVVRWWLLNMTLLACAVAGFGFGVTGAANVAAFVVWFYGFLATCLLFMNQKDIKRVNMPIPLWLDVTYDILFAGVLLWTGHFFLAGLYLYAIITVHNRLVNAE